MVANGFDDDQTRSFTNLAAGTIVSHYKIISKIGAGGMGEVYLTEDTQLDRKVALKFLPPHLSQDEAARARFTREAKASAKLDHPNIVQVFEVGEFQGRPFFAMAHIEGKSLREVIKDGKLSINDAIEFTKQICEGLHKAHESGVVHRDIKPGNIIIDKDNKARLLDFGLATVAGEDKLTKTGSTLGTVGYMSPEQIEGKQVDHRSDLFSVGVILYEMLTGRRPFEGDTDAAVARSITDGTPEPIARYKSGTTGELQQIVDKALSKDPSIRYQTAAGMLADMKRLEFSATSNQKSKLSLWIGIVLVLAVIGYFGYGVIFESSTQAEEAKRLVVLPFNNSGTEDQDYFVSGMADEIVTKLTSINDLRIVARQSAARMKAQGMDISEIGKELGVEYVLDASVHWQESSNGTKRVKLVTQLIKVSDESILWGKSYDTVMTEVFSVQSDMAEQVAEQLGVVLSPEEKTAVWERFTDSEDAWDYFLRGNQYHHRGYYGSKKDMELAISMYRMAIEIDSNFARAYSSISRVCSRLYVTHRDHSDTCRSMVWNYAQRAIDLADLFEVGTGGYSALGYYYARIEEDWEMALETWESSYGGKEKAELSISYLVNAHMVKRYLGLWDEAYEHMMKVVEMEPKRQGAWRDLATVCFRMRKYKEAEKYYKKAIELEPDWYLPSANLASMYIEWQGDTEKARQVVNTLRSVVDTTNHESRYLVFTLDIYDGKMENARARLGELDVDDIGWFYWNLGVSDSARLYYDSCVSIYSKKLESGPGQDGWNLRKQGRNYARLGNSDSAMNFIERAVHNHPYSKDKCFGVDPLIDRFRIFVILGELDSAVTQAEFLLSVPAMFDLGSLLLNPDCNELLSHSGFAQLVREYGNEYHLRLYKDKVGAL